ncbi:thiamine pyrophosphate-binding protein [Undibacter mobilis]|uniref:Thiamine pyrophosphate-binding protein n=1 Tax=Undibacter mobilis TaxID=2292256 RepID=A0A371B6V4_9BRAD|nr:thiamine pyrophosphate-binding protein [Undibacter mobilis]RDV03237.1 thiamine pyrophosphate-binding protein [Undibacter mobilis]
MVEIRSVELPENVGTNREMIWNSDLAAEMLRILDIPYIAINPGASYRGFEDSLVNYLGNRGPQMLVCLHEDHVVSIAHGYAKVTGKPMACALHSNVGLMHGLMGIFNAWCDRVPMLVIGATGPVEVERRRPWIDWIHTFKDQGAMLRHFTKWDDEPRSPMGIVQAFLKGAHMTRDLPQAPVYICLDAGLQEQAIGRDIALPDPRRYEPANPPSGSPEDIADIARRIAKAKCPVFLFGRGSRLQSDWDRRVELAEAYSALVITSQHERAVFPTAHPLHVGAPIDPISSEAKQALAAADLVVSFDWVDLSGLIQHVETSGGAFTGSLVHVSLDLALHNGASMDYFGIPAVDRTIKADPDAFLTQLLPALRGLPSAAVPRQQSNPTAGASTTISTGAELTSVDIEKALADERGQQKFTVAHIPLTWDGTIYDYRDPLDFLGHDGGAGLAAGPGITIGAALALKGSGRPVISVMGDGDFLQGATALWTAAHYGIPALFIVANNQSNFNDEIHQNVMASFRDRPLENRWIGQRLSDPEIDLATIAKGQGVDGEGPVKTAETLHAAIKRGLAAVREGRPYLIDVHIARPKLAKASPTGRVGR